MTPTVKPDAGRNASPFLYGEETTAVAKVLEAGQYGHTDVTEEFERCIAEFLGVCDAVAVMSGTAALHTALLAAEVGPGHEVVVPSMTFCATIQAILAVGATPVFVDIEPATLCVTDQLVMDAVTGRTRAVMPVLFGGRAIDFSGVRKELAARDIAIVEDAAHAFGSRIGARRVGATGNLTCFSFGPIKNLTCGQGGVVIPRGHVEAATLRRIRWPAIRVRDGAADHVACVDVSPSLGSAVGRRVWALEGKTRRSGGALARLVLTPRPGASLVYGPWPTRQSHA
jgi:dTDP-4-amino-4,6-dideoxygalactose transaminase